MKTSIDVKIKPFSIPHFFELEGIENQELPLNLLSEETLSKLCEDFTDRVFKWVGKNYYSYKK